MADSIEILQETIKQQQKQIDDLTAKLEELYDTCQRCGQSISRCDIKTCNVCDSDICLACVHPDYVCPTYVCPEHY